MKQEGDAEELRQRRLPHVARQIIPFSDVVEHCTCVRSCRATERPQVKGADDGANGFRPGAAAAKGAKNVVPDTCGWYNIGTRYQN